MIICTLQHFTHEEIPPPPPPGTCWMGDWVGQRTGLDVSEKVFPLGYNNVNRIRRTGSLRPCGTRRRPACKTRQALKFCRNLQPPSAGPQCARSCHKLSLGLEFFQNSNVSIFNKTDTSQNVKKPSSAVLDVTRGAGKASRWSSDTFCCERAENGKTESQTRWLYNAASLPTGAK